MRTCQIRELLLMTGAAREAREGSRGGSREGSRGASRGASSEGSRGGSREGGNQSRGGEIAQGGSCLSDQEEGHRSPEEAIEGREGEDCLREQGQQGQVHSSSEETACGAKVKVDLSGQEASRSEEVNREADALSAAEENHSQEIGAEAGR